MKRIPIPACLLICLAFGCSSSGESAPDRDTGSAGSSGTAGAPGGKADDPGAGGEGTIGGAPSFVLPEGCVPDDMRFACNPVTNEGCEGVQGEACEYGLDEYFNCFPAPNEVEEGGACNWESGPYCQATLTCDASDPLNPEGVCRRHCCSDADCAAPETCHASDPTFGTLGVCRF